MTASPAPRRTVPIRQDIDEAMIERLVRAFYGRVRAHPRLGPIFERAIGDDWEPHLQKMFGFWSSVMLQTGRYRGNPMAVHMRLDGVDPTHFEDWLALFRETAAEECPPEIAGQFVARAERIAQSFRLGMFYDPSAAKDGSTA